jgi:D-arabinose 1-dehydrogenase-like Zn-dependent alcohol dehydrogenase
MANIVCLAKGGQVALLAVPGCGLDTCTECSRDLAQLCPSGMHHGIGQDGFYAEYVGIDARGAVPLPDGTNEPPLDLLFYAFSLYQATAKLLS